MSFSPKTGSGNGSGELKDAEIDQQIMASVDTWIRVKAEKNVRDDGCRRRTAAIGVFNDGQWSP